MTIQDAPAWVQAVATGVVAVFAVRGYRSATRAVAAANASVVAANASVVAARSQTQLAQVPFVRLDRPKMGMEPNRAPYIVVPAVNLGPRLALELRLDVERRDADEYRPERGRGVAPIPMLEAEARGEFKLSALDIASTGADWEGGIKADGTGVPPTTQPFVPSALRFTVSYLSMLGATVKLTYTWETGRIELPHDPWTWRLGRLTIDPGPGNGAPIVVTLPE